MSLPIKLPIFALINGQEYAVRHHEIVHESQDCLPLELRPKYKELSIPCIELKLEVFGDLRDLDDTLLTIEVAGRILDKVTLESIIFTYDPDSYLPITRIDARCTSVRPSGTNGAPLFSLRSDGCTMDTPGPEPVTADEIRENFQW